MTTDSFKTNTVRRVWKSSNSSKLLTVTGLLETGEYEIEESTDGKGNKVLTFKKV